MGRPHKRLIVWQEAVDLTEFVYRFTGAFPAEERFGLISQMRRAAVSVPSNIAEGAARGSSRDKLQFYIIARGSLSELDTHKEIAARLGYSTPEIVLDFETKISRVGALLQGLIDQKKESVAVS